MHTSKCLVFGFAKNLLKLIYIINILQYIGYSWKLKAEYEKKNPQTVALGKMLFLCVFLIRSSVVIEFGKEDF